ncbi:hypothetical protein Rhopal_006317-T1 [Rhodotorula paludigena]|uniref:Protein kinase domain-containing protein n=1 Tax=Rhodotorula paludigena TaxID=86838 RepID=A0AAV5GUU2_9BASI|nr:hypothetical protein Rhopal_006317-T1 [Rhodotorula paludigena]
MSHTLADVLNQLRVGDWANPTASASSAPTPVKDLIAFEAHSDLLPDGVYRDEGLATWLWDRVTRKLPSLIADKVVVDGEKPAAPTWETVRDRIFRLVVELRSAHATSTLFRAIDDALLEHIVRFDRGVQDDYVRIALAKIIVEARIFECKNILFEDTVSYFVGRLVSNPNGGYNVLLSPLLPLRPRPGQAPTLPQVITATCFAFDSDASDCDARVSAAQATTLPERPYHDAHDPFDNLISSSEDELILLNPQGHAVFPKPLPPRESTSVSSSVGSHRELSEFGSYRSRTTIETSFASLDFHSPSSPRDEPHAPFDKALLLSDAATGSASTTTPTRGGLVLQILRTHAERQTCVIFDAALAPSPSSAPTHVVKMDWITGESALEHEVAMHAALQGSAQGALAYGDLVVPLWGAFTVPSRARRPGERVVAVFEHGGSAPLAWSEVPLDSRIELVVKLAKLHQQHRLVHGDARPSNVAIASAIPRPSPHPPTDPLATPTLGTLELDDAPSSSSPPQPQARWTDLGRAVPHVDPCRGRRCAELRRVALEMGLAEDMATKRAVARAMRREGLGW